MTLEELGYNRFGYKADQAPADFETPESMSAGIFDSFNTNKNQNRDFDSKDARQIVTNTVITSCLIQSSGGEGRIEIFSSITNPPPNFSPDNIATDALVAYNNNQAVVVINKYGISAIKIIANDLFVHDHFYIREPSLPDPTYISQPLIYYGRIKFDGTPSLLPAGWSIIHVPGSGIYQVVHNLATTTYALSITDFTEFGGPAAIITWTTQNPLLNSFQALSFDATGTPTDSSFYFQLFRNLP